MVSSGSHAERGALKAARGLILPGAPGGQASCRDSHEQGLESGLQGGERGHQGTQGSRKGNFTSLTSLTSPLSPSMVGQQVLQGPYPVCLGDLIRQLNPGR